MIEINSKMPALEMKDLKNKNKDNIKRLATGLQIPLQYKYNKVKDKGWVGEPKGILQVRWEHGFINTKQKINKYYTMAGSKDQYRNVVPGTSLQEIMQSCSDFVNKKNLLQDKLSTLGVQVHRSPKCHSKLAREGIKFSWGYAKNYYHCLPLNFKRKKENFCQSVQSAMA